MELFKLFGTFGINGVDEAQRELNGVTATAEKSGNKLSSVFKKIGAAIATAFAIDKIKNFGKAIVEAAAEVDAETSAFTQIMGDYSDEASAKVQKIADATGMVATRLTPYMTSMSAKFKGLGYDIEDATDYASRGLNLAADAAAFWDKSLDDSMGALNSFINGSYEGGEAIGLFANDTQMAQYAVQHSIVESTKDWANLDEATKQATRLEYAENMFKLSGATGQAAKESTQYANVMANLKESWRQFKAEIGKPLLDSIVLPVMRALEDFITNKLIPSFNNLKAWINDNKETIKKWADGISTATGIIVGFVAALKAAQMINTLGVMISKAGSAIAAYAAKLAAATIAGQVSNATLSVQNIVLGVLSGQIGITTAATMLWKKAQDALNKSFLANPITWVILAIAALVAIFVVAYKNSETFRNAIQQLWGKIKELWEVIKEQLKPVFDEFMGVLEALWKLVEATIIPMFKEIMTEVLKLWAVIKPIVEALLPIFKAVFQNILQVVTTSLKNVLEVVKVVLNTIKNVINLITAVIKGDWSGAWNAIKNIFSGIWDGIKNIASNAVNGIKNMFENMFDGVKKTVEKLKNLFNFTWSLPKLKMPHFKVSGNFSLNPLQVPKFSVDWYKKAMDNGMILNDATIFGMNSAGQLMGGGEAGSEAIVGTNSLRDMVNSAVRSETSGLSNSMNRIIEMLASFFPQILDNDKAIVLDSGALVGKLAPAMNVKFSDMAKANARGR